MERAVSMGGEGAAVTAADHDSREAKRSAARSGTWVMVLGAIVLGAAVSWWICVVQRTQVYSEADLSSVGFGVPLPWIVQDLSATPFAAYPAETRMLLTGNSAWDAPASYDWLAFSANTLLWGAVVWGVGALVMWLLAPARRASLR